MQPAPGYIPTPAMRVEEVTLAGNFVILEPLRPSHADELFPDAMEPELFRFIAPGAEQSKKSLRDWIVARIEEQHAGSALPFLQRDAVTKKAFGATCMMNISTQHHRLEVGQTWLAKSHRKTPANTEGKLLLLTHAFETMEAVRVQFKVDVRNTPAQQALERIGAVKEGTMRNERILGDGFVRDAFVYSIIDREWPEVKKRLNHLLWTRPEEAVPLKRPPPPIPGLEATLRPAAAAYKGMMPAYKVPKALDPTPTSGSHGAQREAIGGADSPGPATVPPLSPHAQPATAPANTRTKAGKTPARGSPTAPAPTPPTVQRHADPSAQQARQPSPAPSGPPPTRGQSRLPIAPSGPAKGPQHLPTPAPGHAPQGNHRPAQDGTRHGGLQTPSQTIPGPDKPKGRKGP